MNLRRCFAPRQLLFLLAAGLLTTGAGPAGGQETITLHNGQPQQVRILGTTPTGVKVEMGAGMVMVQPFSNITQVTMGPPPEFAAAIAAYERGDLQTALRNTQSVVSNYRALPTDWAQQAVLMLGDIYVSMNQLPQAQLAYVDYKKAYPAAPDSDEAIGLARIDVANKNEAAAEDKLKPVLDQALTERNPSRIKSAMLGRAFLVSGQLKEQKGDLPGALEDYLRTATIFTADRVAATTAQQKADTLRKDHGTAVP